MAKRHRDMQETGAPPPKPPRHFPLARRDGQGLAVATLVGVMALLMISFSNWREIDRIEKSLDERMGQIETRIGQVADKMDNLPTRAAQPARRGPDPNRVYQIKTAGSPARGPTRAAVTIAEFSDFQ